MARKDALATLDVEVLFYGTVVGLICGILWAQLHFWPLKGRTKNKERRPRFRKDDLYPVFPNGWIPVLESSKLKTNQVECLSLLGMELVALRTEDGVAHVMNSHCPHLGAHVGVMGRVVKDCIECPFHGWRFRASDGKCTHVPYASKVPEFAKLKTWPCRDTMSFIFIWYHADHEEPSWELEDEPETIKGTWKQAHRFEKTVYCHIEDIFENGADLAHFNTLHKLSSFVSKDEFSRNAGRSWKGRLQTFHYEASCTFQGRKSSTAVTIQPRLLGYDIKWTRIQARYTTIGPAFCLSRSKMEFAPFKTIMAITPIRPFQQKMVILTFTESRVPSIVGKFYGHVKERMIDRDVVVWSEKIRQRNPLIVKEEQTVASFRKWYSQFYSDNSPTWRDITDNTIEW